MGCHLTPDLARPPLASLKINLFKKKLFGYCDGLFGSGLVAGGGPVAPRPGLGLYIFFLFFLLIIYKKFFLVLFIGDKFQTLSLLGMTMTLGDVQAPSMWKVSLLLWLQLIKCIVFGVTKDRCYNNIQHLIEVIYSVAESQSSETRHAWIVYKTYCPQILHHSRFWTLFYF